MRKIMDRDGRWMEANGSDTAEPAHASRAISSDESGLGPVSDRQPPMMIKPYTPSVKVPRRTHADGLGFCFGIRGRVSNNNHGSFIDSLQAGTHNSRYLYHVHTSLMCPIERFLNVPSW